MKLIHLEEIEKRYESGAIALYPFSLTLNQNQKLGIVGETGSGKSTLLKVMAGMLAPDGGKVIFKGEVLPDPNEQLIPGHPAIAYLSQHFELPFFRTVEEIVYDPYKISEENVSKLYKACHIEHLLQADSQQLSGGEKQRVALAKLLVDEPELLLLDEPFSNLDLNHQNLIKRTLESIENEFDTTIVLVAHNPLDVLSWADTVIAMKSGRIIQKDKPFNIYNYPNNEYVAGLFGPYNVLKASNWKNHSGDSKEKVIIRPEAFVVSKKQNNGSEGKVLKVAYFGGYEQLTVLAGDEELIINSAVGDFECGDLIYIELNIN